MRHHSRYRRWAAALAFLLGALLAAPRPALAHSLKVWVRVAEGATVKGRAYFPGGGRARGVEVQVFGPDERLLGKATTDDQGEFTYTATTRCDHTFVVETGDGHRDEKTIPADQFPVTLPMLTGESGKTTTDSSTAPEITPTLRTFNAPPSEKDELGRLVDRAVARHVGPLQDQIAEYESRRRLHDILGGIGYIIGATGIVFYFKARRGKVATRATNDRD
jgi:nickel transport protein